MFIILTVLDILTTLTPQYLYFLLRMAGTEGTVEKQELISWNLWRSHQG